jgi:L-ascorbate metabolism protein UlaG (beta-lactamase superfamily)
MNLDTLVYAGHSAVFLTNSTYTIAIDPWLSANPLCPEELKEPARIDLIIATHGHGDHADEVPSLAKRYGAKVLANYELGVLFKSMGVPEGSVIPANKGGTIVVNGLAITLTQAFHSSSFVTADGPQYAGEPCGVVVRSQRESIYHAGDTVVFSDMKYIKELYSPSVALFPIGDCFTMGPREAALAADLINADISIPIHYGTFPLLTGKPEQFEAACREKGLQAMTIKPGGRFDLQAR